MAALATKYTLSRFRFVLRTLLLALGLVTAGPQRVGLHQHIKPRCGVQICGCPMDSTTDGHECTPIEVREDIRVHPCPSVVATDRDKVKDFSLEFNRAVSTNPTRCHFLHG